MPRPASPPMHKRIALAVVVLHGLVLWLLVLVNRARVPEQPPEQPQFVSAWIQAYTPPALAAPPPRGAGVPRTVTPRRRPVETPPPVLPVAPAPVVPAMPAATPGASAPPVDWTHEELLAAQRAAAAAAAAAKQDTFSPPPKVLAKTCKPKQGSMEWKGEEDRTVTMDGIFPVFRLGKRCVLVLFLPYCVLNKLPEANQHLLDDMDAPDRSRSSVPDPNICD